MQDEIEKLHEFCEEYDYKFGYIEFEIEKGKSVYIIGKEEKVEYYLNGIRTYF